MLTPYGKFFGEESVTSSVVSQAYSKIFVSPTPDGEAFFVSRQSGGV
jgi:hypothetical protein